MRHKSPFSKLACSCSNQESVANGPCFLFEMLVEAVNQSPGKHGPTKPSVARYVQNDGVMGGRSNGELKA